MREWSQQQTPRTKRFHFISSSRAPTPHALSPPHQPLPALLLPMPTNPMLSTEQPGRVCLGRMPQVGHARVRTPVTTSPIMRTAMCPRIVVLSMGGLGAGSPEAKVLVAFILLFEGSFGITFWGNNRLARGGDHDCITRQGCTHVQVFFWGVESGGICRLQVSSPTGTMRLSSYRIWRFERSESRHQCSFCSARWCERLKFCIRRAGCMVLLYLPFDKLREMEGATSYMCSSCAQV